ncbi:acyl carrier protein [Paenibacillus sp. HW567]|uniref:acyl carrier protein n=1 Tax=Paenibacillus sp. HW567 TaxID=1034769 RepID=UPI00035D20FC|nr:acyl carrier protein [Paenibacillus sp. HW567]
MNTQSFDQKVDSIIQEVMQTKETIPDDQSLDELGLTSMKFIELVIKCEERFEFNLEDSYLLKEFFDTPAKIKETLQQQHSLTEMKEL